MDTNSSVLSYEMNKINVDEKWSEQSEAQKAEIERLRAIIVELQMEVECEERRFNDLFDDYAALSKKTDKYRAIVEELNECSAYWSDWEIPIGLRDRLKEA